MTWGRDTITTGLALNRRQAAGLADEAEPGTCCTQAWGVGATHCFIQELLGLLPALLCLSPFINRLGQPWKPATSSWPLGDIPVHSVGPSSLMSPLSTTHPRLHPTHHHCCCCRGFSSPSSRPDFPQSVAGGGQLGAGGPLPTMSAPS